ncbi:uncharacterized protein BP5553_05395 [Venustampulla echinocandica]|uniref:Uncharacterized protein n=1 Tax=Venustampulla echinocandica TaxID=2656787 RepID=A0A370TR13_9HELO|nr:uncharacterized protein BP5553_05395 [Venustampulla echinocandica]RDL37962.1 hypothetical protein BP5553_05395 [Venustampulla echinocandica]
MTSTWLFKRLIVEHHSAILNLPGEDVIPQDADHLEIARFSSKDDRNFPPMLARLRTLSRRLASEAQAAQAVEQQVQSGVDIPQGMIHISNARGYPDSTTLFEVPFAPCETFKGRKNDLGYMQEFFSASNDDGQLKYVLSGLGGCGKTHTALKYAYNNRFKYKNGVIFFNASSKTTLIADFTRVSELLKLPQSSNKVEGIKQWFSRAENSDWLFIFDNADDMTSVPLSSYIPRTTRGHLIITTRDETAIGKVSEHGHSIKPLEPEEAIQVLFSKARIAQPSADDVKQAGEIVELLGCLPLAVDQAGAFIRTQQKPLREYRRLFEDRILEVVKTSPQRDSIENSYLTVWEINFRQTEKDCPMAAKLLLLLSFLEGTDIPESMLRRGCSPKKVWDTNAESTVLRLQGDTQASQDALENHIRNSIGPGLDEDLESDARWNAQRGELVLSFAENLLRMNNSARTKVELADWKPLNLAAPSAMEKLVAQSRDVTLGRLLRNDGQFKEALPIFERLLKETGSVTHNSTGWQLVMFNNVSDLYCEVGRPLDVEAVIEEQLKLVYARKWENIPTGRRLQLALVESLIRRGEFRPAETCLDKLILVLEADEDPNEVQNTNHFLAWTCLARISHMEGRWDQALICWNRAAGIIEKCCWEKTFSNAIVLFSIAQVLYHTGREDEAIINVQKAEVALKVEGRRYWIVGLGSYWFDYVCVPLGDWTQLHLLSSANNQTEHRW